MRACGVGAHAECACVWRACGRVCARDHAHGARDHAHGARDHAHGARDHAHGARDLHVPEARMPSLSSGCRFRRLSAVTDGYNRYRRLLAVTDG